MTASSSPDRFMDRVQAGERLSADDITQLASASDILAVGMLADAVRRSRHGARVTYLRVATHLVDRPFAGGVPAAAREIRLAGAPDTLEAAIAAVDGARGLAAGRVVAGLSWSDVERLASAAGVAPSRALADLRAAGLDALAEIPLDTSADLSVAIESLRRAGFGQLRLTVDRAAAAERTALMLRAAALQEEFGGIQAINPLPTLLQPLRPTTGYEDVKAVAIARLAAPNIPTIQVDWSRYGPKLAQVALTFGADDLDDVTASDEAPDGTRRAPLEEVRRNIEAAGFSAAERDGRFNTADRT